MLNGLENGDYTNSIKDSSNNNTINGKGICETTFDAGIEEPILEVLQ